MTASIFRPASGPNGYLHGIMPMHVARYIARNLPAPVVVPSLRAACTAAAEPGPGPHRLVA